MARHKLEAKPAKGRGADPGERPIQNDMPGSKGDQIQEHLQDTEMSATQHNDGIGGTKDI